MTVRNDIEKRNLIKQAARELFFRFGYSKTSMEDIARQSGMAKPTLYYYYANKEEIFDEVVIEEAQLFMDRVEKKLPRNVSADQKLEHFFRTIYEDLKFYALKMSDMPDYLCEYSPHGHPIVKKINNLFLDKLLPLLRKGKEDGVWDFNDEQMISATLVFMTEFLNLDWIRHYPEEFCDRVVETMINITLNGLKRRHECSGDGLSSSRRLH